MIGASTHTLPLSTCASAPCPALAMRSRYGLVFSSDPLLFHITIVIVASRNKNELTGYGVYCLINSGRGVPKRKVTPLWRLARNNQRPSLPSWVWNIEHGKAPDRQCISFSPFYRQLSRTGHVLYPSLRIEFNPVM